jgi:hypothetical protein
MLSVEAEGAAALAFETAEGAVLNQGPLEFSKLLADELDQIARAAEIDGMLAAVFAISEAIVRAEGLAVATAPTGGDVALAGEELGPQGEKAESRVVELVSGGLDFHFQDFS